MKYHSENNLKKQVYAPYYVWQQSAPNSSLKQFKAFFLTCPQKLEIHLSVN